MGLNNNEGYEKLNEDDRNTDNSIGYSSVPLDNSSLPSSIQQQQPQFVLPQQQNPYYPQAPQYNQYTQQPQFQQVHPQNPYYLPPHLQQQVPQQQNLQPLYVHEYPAIPNVIVKTSQNEDEQDFTPALIIFVVGFCFCFAWFINIKYLKSKNKNARTLAICSVVFGVLYALFFFLVFIPLMVRVSNERSYYNYD